MLLGETDWDGGKGSAAPRAGFHGCVLEAVALWGALVGLVLGRTKLADVKCIRKAIQLTGLKKKWWVRSPDFIKWFLVGSRRHIFLLQCQSVLLDVLVRCVEVENTNHGL